MKASEFLIDTDFQSDTTVQHCQENNLHSKPDKFEAKIGMSGKLDDSEAASSGTVEDNIDSCQEDSVMLRLSNILDGNDGSSHCKIKGSFVNVPEDLAGDNDLNDQNDNNEDLFTISMTSQKYDSNKSKVGAMQFEAVRQDCDTGAVSDTTPLQYVEPNDYTVLTVNSADDSVLCKNILNETSVGQIINNNLKTSVYETPLLMEVQEEHEVILGTPHLSTRRREYISCFRCMSQQCICVKGSNKVKKVKRKILTQKRDSKHTRMQNKGSAKETYTERQYTKNLKSGVKPVGMEDDKPLKRQGLEYNCSACGFNFKQKLSWAYHVESKHYHTYELQCDRCFVPFLNQYEKSSHICSSANSMHHICILCNDETSFRYKRNLYDHLKTKHNNKFPLKCETCNKPLASYLEQNQHMAAISCSKVTKNEDTKVAGEKIVSQHLCEYCGRVVGQLSVHKNVCLNTRKYKCSTCEKTFNWQQGLKFHILRNHTDKKPYACHQCDTRWITKSELYHHMRRTHSMEKKYQCRFCEKKFVANDKLNRHERIHLKINPFTCEYCERSFSTKWNMEAHMRQHTKDTPYTCSKCGKGFAHNVVRKSHEFKCDSSV